MMVKMGNNIPSKAIENRYFRIIKYDGIFLGGLISVSSKGADSVPSDRKMMNND